MKKFISLFITILMVFCFASCSETSAAPTNSLAVNSEEAVPAFTEQMLVNESDVSFTITSAPYEDDFWGMGIKVRLENNTDKTLMYSLDNVSVNGYMVNVLFATEVAPDKKDNTSITIFSSDLEENQITKIDEIEFELNIYDTNDWMAPYIVDSRICKIKFN